VEDGDQTITTAKMRADLLREFTPIRLGFSKHIGKLTADSIAFYIGDAPDPLIVSVPSEAIFGRFTLSSLTQRIDLSDYAQYMSGVSRLHVAIRRNDDHQLEIQDLGSTNGTWINGERITAHQFRLLKSGDALKLGWLNVRLYFEQPEPTS
jgi:pSer/pThr/pTyr-binding forkhead associated (FHA) protein